MASDPTKPLLRLRLGAPQGRVPGKRAAVPRPEAYPTDRQGQRFGPIFRRLAEVLGRDPAALQLRADPTALAPERLLVFEVRGGIAAFAKAIQRVSGLEFVDEEELASDEDKAPVAYLLVPDARALSQIEGLWRTWQGGGQLPDGFTPWRDVFACLRDLRAWGPSDRVQAPDAGILSEEIFGKQDDEHIALEIELVFRRQQAVGASSETTVFQAIQAQGGAVISRARLDDIAYHALLVRLPVRAIRPIVERSQASIAGLEPVMHIRPQSIASVVEVEDGQPLGPLREADDVAPDPILAILDGVPVARHALLDRHIVVEDLYGLEPAALVSRRVHGTAMASLIVHGDRNYPEAPLPRRIHCIPVLGSADAFPQDRLIVDVIYQAVFQMRGAAQPSAPHVIVINLSLGNRRRQFYGHLSPWARLLDRLSYRFGILFVVSAGNVLDEFSVPAFRNSLEFESALPRDRAGGVIAALAGVFGDRRLITPAETVNGLTIGARNLDSVSPADRRLARSNIDPFPQLDTANPSSALGPGFADSVKPDILMPGAREHLRVVASGAIATVSPGSAGRGAGLKVAAPPAGQGIENAEAFTNGTSAAAALASRTAHRIHDALERAYGEEFLRIPSASRAVLLKALLVHPARWPTEAADLVRELLGPFGRGQASRQKDNIRRFLGYGAVDPDDAVACADDRATFWAVGSLSSDQRVDVAVPVPAAYGGKARSHSVAATLAWFTPVLPGRKSNRAVRLKILDPTDIDRLSVAAHGMQPDGNQSNRGTVYSRCWSGERAAVVTADMTLQLSVQREPDAGARIDDAVPFGLAVTIAMPGITEIYDQVRDRLRDALRQPLR